MGTKKWSEIKNLSKATEADRAEARAELEAEILLSVRGRRSQEILDNADELAKKFEDFDPTDGTERRVSEYLLQRAALARARSEPQIVEAVEAARAEGVSWGKIGALLGTSERAAQQGYGSVS